MKTAILLFCLLFAFASSADPEATLEIVPVDTDATEERGAIMEVVEGATKEKQRKFFGLIPSKIGGKKAPKLQKGFLKEINLEIFLKSQFNEEAVNLLEMESLDEKIQEGSWLNPMRYFRIAKRFKKKYIDPYSLRFRSVVTNSPQHNYLLGMHYLNGVILERDLTKAEKFIRKAANLKYPQALYLLSFLHVKTDTKLASMFYREGIKHDTPEAQYEFAQDLLKRNLETRGVEQQAFKWFKVAGGLGHPKAAQEVFIMYYKGRGVDKNYYEAYKWLWISRILSTGKNQYAYKDVIFLSFEEDLRKNLSAKQVEKAEEEGRKILKELGVFTQRRTVVSTGNQSANSETLRRARCEQAFGKGGKQ